MPRLRSNHRRQRSVDSPPHNNLYTTAQAPAATGKVFTSPNPLPHLATPSLAIPDVRTHARARSNPRRKLRHRTLEGRCLGVPASSRHAPESGTLDDASVDEPHAPASYRGCGCAPSARFAQFRSAYRPRFSPSPAQATIQRAWRPHCTTPAALSGGRTTDASHMSRLPIMGPLVLSSAQRS